MGFSRSYIKERNRFVNDAKRAPFQDAVFLIHYYNHEVKRWGPPPKPPDIAPEEVFSRVEEDLYREAEARACRLMEATADVGAAYFQYQGARPYNEQLKILRRDNPGYGERCYELAIEKGCRDMR